MAGKTLKPTWWIARELAIGTETFKRIAAKLSISPAGYFDQTNRRGALWDTRIVRQLRGSEEVQAAHKRAGQQTARLIEREERTRRMA